MAWRFATNRRRFNLSPRTKPQKTESQQTTKQVHRVCTRQKIKERTVRITRNVNPLRCQLPPRDQLRNKKPSPSKAVTQQVSRISILKELFEFSSRDFKRDAADQNQRRACEKHSVALPVVIQSFAVADLTM